VTDGPDFLPPVEAIDGLLAETLPAVMAHLLALQARVVARMVAAPNKTRDARECTDVRAPSEWLTASDVAAWLGYSKRTARRYMHDGTWREGEHWFRNGRSRPRFRRSALEAWLRTPHRPSAPALGLAFGADIPPGRRRRLTSLRNKGTSTRNGATEGAEADGAAGGVPGAGAAHGAARSG